MQLDAVLVLATALLASTVPAPRRPRANAPQQPLPEAEERDEQRQQAECTAAEARARSALAEGKREVAATELRKVVEYRQKQADRVRRRLSRFCDPEAALLDVGLPLAEARASLAELEGKTEGLVGELQKVVRYRERLLERVQRAFDASALGPEELVAAWDELFVADRRLAAARRARK